MLLLVILCAFGVNFEQINGDAMMMVMMTVVVVTVVVYSDQMRVVIRQMKSWTDNNNISTHISRWKFVSRSKMIKPFSVPAVQGSSQPRRSAGAPAFGEWTREWVGVRKCLPSRRWVTPEIF